MKIETYDVIIVGTGAAGLYAALSLPDWMKILMITKAELEKSDSYLAQGGICTLLGTDDYDEYYHDTMEAGHYENRPESVREMILSSPEVIQKLMDYGVEFDYEESGEISYTREGGHSKKRILHHQDITGKEIVTKLIARVKERKNITLHEYEQMVEILSEHAVCLGILAMDRLHEMHAYYAKGVILATGGLGGLFKNSTNFPHITGDSFGIALRQNIALEHLHYIQIHPTTLYTKKKGRRFLISESVRGEGAVLYNEEGKRFVNELLPRDVVTEAIWEQMQKYQTDHVYLSFEAIAKDEILSHFPNIYQRCLEEGYDVTKERIPITPAQHYLMGGIRTNINGETSMKHLYAVGETACNGVHGANRLASNSLLESLVFARNAARCIQEQETRNRFLSRNIRSIDATMRPLEEITNWREFQDVGRLQEENKAYIFGEMKRKDSEFYDKWCNDET